MRKKPEEQLSILSMSECHLEHQVMLDLSTVKGKEFFHDVGEWMLKCVSYFHVECAEQDIKPPCIHVQTLMMSRPEFNTFIVGALLDDLGIVH